MTGLATAVETRIAVPYERVWHALRDRDELRRWHGWEFDGLDAEIDVIYLQGVEADEAAGTLAMADGSRFELERAGDATVVRLLMPAPDVDREREYHELREGWTSFVTQLEFALERHPGEYRRTLRLTGSGEPPLDAPGRSSGDGKIVRDAGLADRDRVAALRVLRGAVRAAAAAAAAGAGSFRGSASAGRARRLLRRR